jgi:hypothetical protein
VADASGAKEEIDQSPVLQLRSLIGHSRGNVPALASAADRGWGEGGFGLQPDPLGFGRASGPNQALLKAPKPLAAKRLLEEPPDLCSCERARMASGSGLGRRAESADEIRPAERDGPRRREEDGRRIMSCSEGRGEAAVSVC